MGLPSRNFLQAIEDCHVGVITKENLNLIFSKSAKWEHLGRLVFEVCPSSHEVRLRSLIAETAHERYKRLAKHQPESIRRTPQIYLANFLGITPQSLSRLRRKKLQKERSKEGRETVNRVKKSLLLFLSLSPFSSFSAMLTSSKIPSQLYCMLRSFALL